MAIRPEFLHFVGLYDNVNDCRARDGRPATRGGEHAAGPGAGERAARERVERLEQALNEVQKVRVAEPGRKAQKQPRVSATDPEARFMKQSGGGYATSRNRQISTDAALTLIVGVGVTQSANDKGPLPPGLEEVKRNLGGLPRQGVADAAYTPRETVLKMAERRVDFIGPTVEVGKRSQPRPGIDAAFHAWAFIYEAESATYLCPVGKELLRRGVQPGRAGVLHRDYSARTADCRGCTFRKRVVRGPRRAAFCARMMQGWPRPSWRKCRRPRRMRSIGCAVPWPNFPTHG